MFDKVAEVIAETGILKGRRKRCVDSTVFDDAVATQDTVTQLVAAVRKVARLVSSASEVTGQACVGDYAKGGKPDIDWDDPPGKIELVCALVSVRRGGYRAHLASETRDWSDHRRWINHGHR